MHHLRKYFGKTAKGQDLRSAVNHSDTTVNAGDPDPAHSVVTVEIAITALSTLGIALIVAAVLIRLVQGPMVKTTAVITMRDGTPYLRWYDHAYTIHETTGHNSDDLLADANGEIQLYYNTLRPSQWQVHKPHRITNFCIATGIILAISITVVPLFLQ